MPASGFLFAQSVIFLMLVATLIVGGITRLFGRPATSVMVPLAIVFAIACPFLFFWRTAVYGGSPAYGDASLGWPLIYSHAQSDAGLTSFHVGAFITDFALGTFIGVFYILFRRRHAIQRNV